MSEQRTPRISVVICTHNRAAYLETALESLTAQTLAPREFEVIVVDNASTDTTCDVTRQFQARLANLRYVREEVLGLSQARNTGATACAAPFLAYLDDDARAEPGWLAAILRALETVTPSPAAVGGRVWLDWGGAAPAWLPPRYYTLYSCLDLGAQGHFLSESEYLVGASMAFSKSALDEIGGFDTHLGRQGTKLISGEEAAVLSRLRDKHRPLYYEPGAVAWHAVHPARQSRRWFLSRLFWDGASQPLLDPDPTCSRGHYLRLATYDLRRIVRFAGQAFVSVIRPQGDPWLVHVLNIVQRTGRLRTHLWLAARGRA